MEYNFRVDVTEVVYVYIFNREIARLLHCGYMAMLDGVKQITD
jgi:hypothetical protein